MLLSGQQTTVLLLTLVFLTSATSLLCDTAAAPFCVGQVEDARFQSAIDYDFHYDLGYFYRRYTSLDVWKERSEQLRLQVLSSAGLLPFPKRTSLRAVVFGAIDRGDYIIEKVRFESHPGFYVTGNLYRPGRPLSGSRYGPFPAVLNPVGHWSARWENSAEVSVPGRCINFARQGYVAFSYDMVGYGDCKQMEHSLDGRPESVWSISLGGLETWNGIRALDFLESLPYVDRSRIACTGASGGGFQTYILSAIDDRVKVCAPVCMISTHHPDMCVCQNMRNLRIDTNDVEMGALMAPRPMIVVSATGDFTKNTPRVEYPAIRHVYGLFGAVDNAASVQVDAGHNYNKDSREAVYSWFGKFLPKRPLPQPVLERDFRVEKVEDVRVFPDGKLPDGALNRDGLIRLLMEKSKAEMAAARPIDRRGLRRFRESYGQALRFALSFSAKPVVRAEIRGEESLQDCKVTRMVIQDAVRGAQIPALLFTPRKPRGEAVLMVSDRGKRSLLNYRGDKPGLLASGLLNRGFTVLMTDCFGIGENTGEKDAPRLTRKFSYFQAYNRTDTAERVYDIAAALEYLANRSGARATHIVGMGGGGLWCLLARPFSPKVKRAVVDVNGFDSSSDGAFVEQVYVPHLRRAGDFNTAMALCAPGDLLLHNTQGRFDTSWASAAYEILGSDNSLALLDGKASNIDIIRWLDGR